MSEDRAKAPDGDGPATPRKVWYLAPGAIPVEEGDKRAATATAWAREGDTEWHPMSELAGYRKQQAESDSRSPRARKDSKDQGRLSAQKP